MLDLTNYVARIQDDADKPLFVEAVNCAKAEALRAAYVFIWVACAESIKRRFREAQLRDGVAGKIVGDFEQKEKDQKSIDRFLLEKAKEYGFLTDSSHAALLHVYDMRCVYGHPYEEAPTVEQVTHAASVVVHKVLSQPVRLKHGFGKALLQKLMQEKTFLDDHREAVESFAQDIIPRFDESVIPWFLDSLWSELEKIAGDVSLQAIIRRGIWFSQTILETREAEVFTRDQWHLKTGDYPKILSRVLRRKRLFESIGRNAQDSLLGKVFEHSQKQPSMLKSIEVLSVQEALTDRQRSRFFDHIEQMEVKHLSASGLSTKTCIRPILKALASHNYYIQNPAVELLVANGPEQAEELEQDDQLNLGRNILQAADGNAGEAKSFLKDLKGAPKKWPAIIMRGIISECFTNETNQIRFKTKLMGTALDTMHEAYPSTVKGVLTEVVKSVNAGEPKNPGIGRKEFASAINIVAEREWAKGLTKALKAKLNELPEENDEFE